MKIIENISNIEPELDCNSDILDVAREVALNSEQDSAFLVCDLNTITRNYQGVFGDGVDIKPRFDIFCNCAPLVLHHLSDLGFEFRARNKNEVTLAVSAGVLADRITLDGTAGLVASHLRHATREGVGKVVARTVADLKKVNKEFPNVRIMLSLSAPTGGGYNSSIFDQGSDLLRQSAQMGLRVTGLAFEDADDAIDVRKQLAFVKLLLAVGRSQFGHDGMDALHLGKNNDENLATFAEMSEAVTMTVDVSEAAVASAFVICAKVIGKRRSSIAGGACNRTIVINDGVFGHFGQLLHSDRKSPSPLLLSKSDSGKDTQETLATYCDILGPSGDDADVVGLGLPIIGGREVEVGDWIVFPRMGGEVLTPANPTSSSVPVPVEAGSSYWVLTSDDNVENDADNQTNNVGGGFPTIEAEDCLAAAEGLAVSCNDTDLEMLTGLK